MRDPFPYVAIAGRLRLDFHEEGHGTRGLSLPGQRIGQVVHDPEPILDRGRGRFQRALHPVDSGLQITAPQTDASEVRRSLESHRGHSRRLLEARDRLVNPIVREMLEAAIQLLARAGLLIAGDLPPELLEERLER